MNKLNKTSVAVDPLTFNDPVAEKTSWGPAKRGGASFCAHKLVEKAHYRIEFPLVFGAILFYLAFLLTGLGVLIGFSFKSISQG